MEAFDVTDEHKLNVLLLQQRFNYIDLTDVLLVFILCEDLVDVGDESVLVDPLSMLQLLENGTKRAKIEIVQYFELPEVR